MGDGKTRVATIEDIVVGTVLRSVDSEGYSYPFSDMVVTRCYLFANAMAFDCNRPHASGVETVGMLSASSLASKRYHVLLLASGALVSHQVPIRYRNDIPDYGDVFTLKEWKEITESGGINSDDGHGYWCKDGKESNDEVFSTEAQDATHVAWFNK